MTNWFIHKAYAYAPAAIPLGIGAIIYTESIHPIYGVIMGGMSAAMGWSGYGLYLVGTGKLKLQKFFATIGIAVLAGIVAVTFLPIENFIQLLVTCGLLGTCAEQVLLRARASALNLFGRSSSTTTRPDNDES